MKILIGVIVIVTIFSCLIGVILPKKSEKAVAGDEQAALQTFGLLWVVLIGFGALLWALTFKTGRTPE